MCLLLQCMCSLVFRTLVSENLNAFEVKIQARRQDFQKGGYMDVCMPVCMHYFISMQGLGGGGRPAPPGNFWNFDALRLLLRPFWNGRLHPSSQKWCDSRLFGCRSLLAVSQEKVNSRAPEIVIYLRTYLRPFTSVVLPLYTRASSALTKAVLVTIKLV